MGEHDNNGHYPVMTVHRDDIAELIGDEAAAVLTDDQMREIADGMWNDLMAELFHDSLSQVLTDLGFEIIEEDEDDEGD